MIFPLEPCLKFEQGLSFSFIHERIETSVLSNFFNVILLVSPKIASPTAYTQINFI